MKPIPFGLGFLEGRGLDTLEKLSKTLMLSDVRTCISRPLRARYMRLDWKHIKLMTLAGNLLPDNRERFEERLAILELEFRELRRLESELGGEEE